MNKIKLICKRLERAYGKPAIECNKPLDTLIQTILSQNTSDTNSYRAFSSLKKRFKTWDAVMKAKTKTIEDTIRIGGLPHIKAERIKHVLKEIKHRRGSFDLSFLRTMSHKDAMKWLVSLKGVGPKTAAVVLMFCFNKPIMPVDTHVYRISKRLGIVPKYTTREKTQEILNGIIPDSCKYILHINMIEHGRRICRAKKPLCDKCILNSVCDSAFTF
ncbi:MAG: endonuclease III [Candidatus Diapherotrites archaeon]|nr:endonuclease III [Candidatus Diapherotrites archaeon]